MKRTQITMIDYGASNIRSAQKALEFVGAQVQVTAEPEEVIRATKLVLPGVGAFGAGMAALHQRGLTTVIRAAVSQGTPLLGICLGMQFLFEESEEMGRYKGLGLIPGRVTRFTRENAGKLSLKRTALKIPHMGWNQIEHDGSHPLLNGVPNGSHAYFVHSYYCVPANQEDVIGETEYGCRFASIIGRDNILGIQFHPEKSQSVGLTILRNYLAW